MAKVKADAINTKILDEEQNLILIVRKGNNITLYIKLKSENRKRKIGYINVATKTLHIRRKRALHLFFKFNAYGFCYHIINDAKKFDKIRLKDDFDEWVIPTSFILNKENAKYLHFKGNGGFELQVFLPLDSIEQFKRPQRF